MDIIEKVIAIRDNLPQKSSNLIDYSLASIPPFCGKKTIKLIIIGQDPTIRNIKQRNKIQYALNLDNNKSPLRKYIEKICVGLDLSLDNIYATNIYKYFYTFPPADNPDVLNLHLEPNLKLLESELSDFEKCPIITLGEPVLKLLTNSIKNFVTIGIIKTVDFIIIPPFRISYTVLFSHFHTNQAYVKNFIMEIFQVFRLHEKDS